MSTSHRFNRFGTRQPPGSAVRRPEWVGRSPLLIGAYALAAEAQLEQRRASDQAPLLVHSIEVAELLHDTGYDQTMVAAALLHDAVERGSLAESRLRAALGDRVSDLVMALTEDAKVGSFPDRRRALRKRVEAAGSRATAIFAADVLCNIRELHRGADSQVDELAARSGTTPEGLLADYRESVAMVERIEPESPFVGRLRAELGGLPAQTAVT